MRKSLFVAILTFLSLLTAASSLQAGGRWYSGGHPYHNGFHFVPPASAYEGVRVRPPFWYGAPMYYYPQSYLGGSVPHYYGPTTYQYQYAPAAQRASFYMSAHAAGYSYPW